MRRLSLVSSFPEDLCQYFSKTCSISAYICIFANEKAGEREIVRHELLIVMKKIISALALILILMSACTGNETRLILDEVESYISERPDSALAILRSIPAEQLKGREDNAKYALLYSMALDKNYIDVTSDSLINVAVEYYDKVKDVEKKFLSYYYCGRVQANGGHYAKAMLSYAKAEELIQSIDNKHYIALLYSQIGVINEAVYDYPKSLEAYERAYEYYSLNDSILFQYYSKMSIGQVLLNLKRYEEAEDVLTETMLWSYENQEYNICKSCTDILIILYEASGNLEALLTLYDSPYVKSLQNEMVMYQSLALIYAHKKDGNRARSYMKQAWNEAENINDTTLLLFKDYRINKLLGDSDAALEKYEDLFYIQDSIVRKTLQQPILSAQNDYFKSQAENNKLKLQQTRQRQTCIAIISLLIIIFISFYLRQRLIAKDNEINRYMELAHDLESTLIENKAAVGKMESEMDKMNQQINSLFAGQFSLIDKLSVTYYETHGSRRDKEEIYTKVRKEIEQLSTDKKFLAQLEQIVNDYKGNIMKITRDEMTGFTEMEFRLLCFFYAGFSAKAISIYTNDSVSNIYSKKSRLKSRIAQSNSSQKDLMVGYLS